MKQVCKNCRFWQQVRPPNYREGDPLQCRHTALAAWHAWPFPEETAIGGDHGISTGPDFGCVHWEANPE